MPFTITWNHADSHSLLALACARFMWSSLMSICVYVQMTIDRVVDGERTAMTTRVLVAVWMYWILAPCVGGKYVPNR